MKATESSLVGTPRAPASSGATDANSSGRAIAASARSAAAARIAASAASPPPRPKIEPNRVRAAWIPALPPEPRLKRVRKNTPSASTTVKSTPMSASSASAAPEARAPRAASAPRPSRAIAMPAAIVAANSPILWSIPAAAAASAPGKATWLSASPAKSWPRRTTNQPQTPQASAMKPPASSALRMYSWPSIRRPPP